MSTRQDNPLDDRTLNVQSDYLVVLVATYNRMALLSRTLDSISAGTECPHEIIVIDGGSTDGTVEYLRADPSLTKVFQGALIGTAGSYNQAWRRIESRYTCWLSDDTELVEGSLDLAVRILEEKPSIGMVGLKMKDTEGARKDRAYLGGISKYGILNCNHGVLRTELLRSVGYFNEDYRSYTIDPDLTASVLSAGKAVVMTKQISVLHHRTWDQDGNFDDRARREMGGIDNPAIYSKKFRYLDVPPSLSHRVKKKLGGWIKQYLFGSVSPDALRRKLPRRDWLCITTSRFIRISDQLEASGLPYHLIQRIRATIKRCVNSRGGEYPSGLT